MVKKKIIPAKKSFPLVIYSARLIISAFIHGLREVSRLQSYPYLFKGINNNENIDADEL